MPSEDFVLGLAECIITSGHAMLQHACKRDDTQNAREHLRK